MIQKKIFIISIFSVLFAWNICSQEKDITKTPEGEWCQDIIGNSDYFLDISNYEIKYIEKKTDKYIRLGYRLISGETPKIELLTYEEKDPLKLNEIDADIYKYLMDVSLTIPFTRKDKDHMSFFIKVKDKKGNYQAEEIKLITRTKKEQNLNIAKGVGTAAAVVGALLLADYIADEIEMKNIADDCLKNR